MYTLTYNQLLTDLHQAYYDASRNKHKKSYVQRFEQHLEANLIALCDELYERRYQPRPSSCFIITDPKKREVFAANFRDRIVHHLYYNYTHELYERTFIQDSYSCIRKRGTHYGIRRLEQHIRCESDNYRRPCYILKLDVRGYFMHINREKLLEICLRTMRKMAGHRILKRVPQLWQDRVDMDFVEYLTREIVLLDPTVDCRIVGTEADWEDLPHDKSLFHSPEGCGLPIGNLTSQLFSNIYMNELDQYMKRVLKCRHYGRYVDDFYVVGTDRFWLKRIIDEVRQFLRTELSLFLHEGKVLIRSARVGVEFLGAYLKPWRQVVSRQSLARIRSKWTRIYSQWRNGLVSTARYQSSVASFLGILSHGHKKVHFLREFALFICIYQKKVVPLQPVLKK